MLRQRPSSGGAVPRSSLSSSSSSPGFGHQRTASQGQHVFCSPGHQPHHHQQLQPHHHHPRPDWMSLQDIPDECGDPTEGPNCHEEGATAQNGAIWDGNRKLFVQLLDDMDNIGQVAGVSEGSARRRRKARELFTDWLFNRKTPEVKPSAVSPFVSRNSDNRRFSGDFTDFDIKSPVGGLPTSVGHRPLPGRLERQTPSRRSCGVIGEVQRRNAPQAKARPCSINLSTEHDEADSGYHSGNSAVLGAACKKQGPGELTLTREDLKRRIEKFNATNTHGLLMEMPVERNATFQGFIRVHMNLIRPISIRISTKPLSLYDTISRRRRKEKLQETAKGQQQPQQHHRDKSPFSASADESMMSFRLPKNTSKVIHITSMTTTVEVINVLLSKFNISDSPRKFSLYERTEMPDCKPTMRRMSEDERPLMMCLSWADKGAENLDYNKFVLQENDCGEIMWEAFSLPELESFLTVLDKEERECIQQVMDKFRILKVQMESRIAEMSIKPARDGKKENKKAVLFA